MYLYFLSLPVNSNTSTLNALVHSTTLWVYLRAGDLQPASISVSSPIAINFYRVSLQRLAVTFFFGDPNRPTECTLESRPTFYSKCNTQKKTWPRISKRGQPAAAVVASSKWARREQEPLNHFHFPRCQFLRLNSRRRPTGPDSVEVLKTRSC